MSLIVIRTISLIGKVFICQVKGCLFESNIVRVLRAFNLMVKCKIDNFDILVRF